MKSEKMKSETSEWMKEFWKDPKNQEKIKARNKKISEKAIGRKQSKEHIVNNSKSKIGNTWNKIHGRKKADELRKKLSKRSIEMNPMKIRGGWSTKERKMLSEKRKGKIPWNKGKKGVQKNINISGLEKGHGWNKGIKTGKFIICTVCGKEKYIKTNHYNNSSTKRFFCGIKCKNIFLRLENSPLWRGGKSFEPYDKTFNNQFKRAIRKRDNQVCMLCGIHREKLKRALDVHHINYDKLMSIPQNCISLCQSCHVKTNHNREHWTKFLQSILTEKYSYNYSETLEPIINLNLGGKNNALN